MAEARADIIGCYAEARNAVWLGLPQPAGAELGVLRDLYRWQP